MQLATSSPSSLATDAQGSEESGASERLSVVVQGRLWATMQSKLYDPATARKLWQQSEVEPGTIGEQEEFEDLVEMKGEMDIDQDEDLLGDLADDNFDDLLECLEERERLAVERETDEMLFGNGWHEDEI